MTVVLTKRDAGSLSLGLHAIGITRVLMVQCFTLSQCRERGSELPVHLFSHSTPEGADDDAREC